MVVDDVILLIVAVTCVRTSARVTESCNKMFDLRTVFHWHETHNDTHDVILTDVWTVSGLCGWASLITYQWISSKIQRNLGLPCRWISWKDLSALWQLYMNASVLLEKWSITDLLPYFESPDYCLFVLMPFIVWGLFAF